MIRLTAIHLDAFNYIRFTIDVKGVTRPCNELNTSGMGSRRSRRTASDKSDAMPRYFFIAQGTDRVIGDPEGAEVPNLEAARDASLEIARDLVRQAGLVWEEWSFEIKDGTGQTLLVVPFTDAVLKH
jgi:hypothetical protein